MTDFDTSTLTLKHIKSLEESNKGKTKKKKQLELVSVREKITKKNTQSHS